MATWAQTPSVAVHLEVTQAIQDEQNKIPLVAGRRTAVRASLTLKNDAGLTVSSITRAKLKVSGGSGNPPASMERSPLNQPEFLAFLASKKTYERTNENHTLNFKIPELEKGKWSFQLDVAIKFNDGTTVPGVGAPLTREFVEIRPIRFCLVPISYEFSDRSETRKAPDKARLKQAEEFVRACFPLPESTVFDWQEGRLLPEIDRGGCTIRGVLDAQTTAEEEQSDIDETLDQLLALRSDTERQHSNEEVYYFGWVENVGESTFIADGSNECWPVLGWSYCSVGFGTAREDVAGKVLAHEFGHMLDIEHFEDCDGTGSRPCYLDKDKQVGWDVKTMRARYNCHSFMVSGVKHRKHKTPDDKEALTPDNVWTSAGDYVDCLEALRKDSDEPSECEKQQDTTAPASQTLLVMGGLTANGDKVSWLKPLFPLPWPIRTTTYPGNGPFRVEVVVSPGPPVPSQSFNPRLRVEYAELEKVQARPTYGFFSLAVQIPQGRKVEKVIIWKDGEPAPLKEIGRLPDLPAISTDSIKLDGKPLKDLEVALRLLENRATIQWEAIPSARQVRLRYHVLYSPDGGASFEPVGINLRKHEVAIEPAKLTPSQEGKGLLRIYVSDGLNTPEPVNIDKLTLRVK